MILIEIKMVAAENIPVLHLLKMHCPAREITSVQLRIVIAVEQDAFPETLRRFGNDSR